MKSLSPHVVVCVLGAAIWFGTQALSGRDNFSDQINPWYFGIFYATAFLLGLIARTNAANAMAAGGVLAVSQVFCYLIYPNVSWELGNLFPIAAAFLVVCTAPATLVALLGSVVRGLIFRPNPPV